MSNMKAEGHPVAFSTDGGEGRGGETKTRQRNNMRGRRSGMQMADVVHSWNGDIIVTSCWRQGDIQIAESDVK